MNIRVKDREFELFIDTSEISSVVAAMGEQISADYAGKNPLLIAVLNGSFMFAGDLMKSISGEVEITFIKVASYEATESKGSVEEILGLEKDIFNRHVIVVEDIVDTGLTMTELLKALKVYRPASIEIATLLFKPQALKNPDLSLRYVGKEIENRFVVGYGLDYDGYGRNLPAIYSLAQS